MGSSITDRVNSLRLIYSHVYQFNDYNAIFGDKDPFSVENKGEISQFLLPSGEIIELEGVISFKQTAGFLEGQRSNLYISDKNSTFIINELTGEIEIKTDSIISSFSKHEEYDSFLGFKSDMSLFDIVLQMKKDGEVIHIPNVYSYWTENEDGTGALCAAIMSIPGDKGSIAKLVLQRDSESLCKYIRAYTKPIQTH